MIGLKRNIVLTIACMLLLTGCITAVKKEPTEARKLPDMSYEEYTGGSAMKVVMKAVLNCPDKVQWTMTEICAKSATQAVSKATNAARPNYDCQAGCSLRVSGVASAPGPECVFRINPPEYGNTYSVDLTIECR
jgi:hypothetical protein